MLPPAALLVWTFAQATGGWVVLATDRGVPARFGTAELAMVTREACARALFLVLGPFYLGRGAPSANPTGTAPTGASHRRVPVLLVPGHRMTRASFAFLATYLRSRGFPWLWATSHAHPQQAIAELARALSADVDELCRRTGQPQVDLVGHGMGGLVAAWYLRHLDGERRVRRLVTLGTAWAGTRTAVFGRGRSYAEMLPGSPVLDGLAPPRVPTVCIGSPDDPFVIPSTSAAPPGAESVRIDGCGHVEMLTSARVFRAVVAALDAT